MSKVETYVNEAISIANDNSHGYSQLNRWGLDYDCSSLVITVVQNSGIPVKSNGATYTGNMYNVFKKCGFSDVTSKVNFSTGNGLKRGDILLSPSHHTEIYIGNGKNVGAHSDKDGKTGDSSGREISVASYYNYPWVYALRYNETTTSSTTTSSTTKVTKEVKASGYADSFNKSIAGKYKTTANLHLRNDGKKSAKSLVVMPKGTIVTCYGYYDKNNWYYVQAVVTDTLYTGFCSAAYLEKV